MSVSGVASGTINLGLVLGDPHRREVPVGSEYVLFDISEPGTFTVEVDTDEMQEGDVLELRVYKMVIAGGVTRELFQATFVDAQDSSSPGKTPVKVSVPTSTTLNEPGALRFTLKQTFGSGRSYPWSVTRYG